MWNGIPPLDRWWMLYIQSINEAFKAFPNVYWICNIPTVNFWYAFVDFGWGVIIRNRNALELMVFMYSADLGGIHFSYFAM
jgi:hypothetical protein